MADRMIAARDLVQNAYRINVHTSTLRAFLTAVRQKQLLLQKVGNLPPQYREAAESVAAKFNPNARGVAEDVEWEVVALCFYHYITFEQWTNWTLLNEIAQPDYEDGHGKSLRLYRAKQPVAAGALIVAGIVGYNNRAHHAVTMLSAECLAGLRKSLVDDAIAGNMHRAQVLLLNERKFRLSDDDEFAGDWHVRAELALPSVPPPRSLPLSRVDLWVSVKSRSMVEACESISSLKIPPPLEDPDDIPVNVASAPWVTLRGHAGPEPLPRPPTAFTLPPPVIQCGALDASLFADVTLQPPTVVTEGASRFASLEPINVSSNQGMRSGKFPQYFYVTARVVLAPHDGTSTRPPPSLSMKKGVSLRFRDASRPDAEWRVCDGQQIGYAQPSRGGGFDFTWSDTGYISLTNVATNIAFSASTMIEGECGNGFHERARLHPSLPRWIELRIAVDEDAGAATHDVTVQYANKPLDFPNDEAAFVAEKGLKDIASPDGKLRAFMFVDNTKTLSRTFAWAFVAKEHFEVAVQGQCWYITLQTANKYAYDATKSGVDEIEIETSTRDNFVFKIWGLVSREYPPQMYGLRLAFADPADPTTPIVSRSVHLELPGEGWVRSKREPSESVAGSDTCAVAAVHIPPSIIAAIRSSDSYRGTPPSSAPAASAECTSATPAAEGAATVPQARHVDPSPAAPALPRQTSASPSGFTVLYSDRLGQGAFGAVYRGYNNTRGEFVAVKETLIADNAAMRDALVREFDTLTTLQHPNIVKVHELEVEGRVCRIFMEWLPSGSLRSVLSRTGHRMHEGALRRYFRDALAGLAYLHRHNLCHLDIKPANMLLTADGTVKLADFGTSRLLGGGSDSKTLTACAAVGTPAYMPPEMITAGKYYEGSDMWALACSIVEMASGIVPWSDTVDQEVHSQAIPLMFHIASATPPNHHPTIPEHLSAPLRRILQFCFLPTIASRPKAAALLADEYFTSDCLPLDAESESTFATQTVAHANAAAHAAHTGGSEAGNSLGTLSWTRMSTTTGSTA